MILRFTECEGLTQGPKICQRQSNDMFPLWRRKWQPTPVFLPGKSHGWRSLAGYSPWGHKELDTTKQLHFFFHFNTCSVTSPPPNFFSSPLVLLRLHLGTLYTHSPFPSLSPSNFGQVPICTLYVWYHTCTLWKHMVIKNNWTVANHIPNIITLSNFWLRDFKEPVFVLPPSDLEVVKEGTVAVISTINPQRVQDGFSSVQLLSCVRLFVTPAAAGQASLSITNSQSSLRLMSIQPSHPLSSPSPPAPSPSQHQSVFQWVNSSHEVDQTSGLMCVRW